MNHTNKKIDMWILENTNKHLCGCGCAKFIKIERRHYNVGIPKYVYGHGKKNNNINVWILENTNKYLCGCGCNNFINILRRHYWCNIPKYISGHNPITEDGNKKRIESLKKHYEENEYPESAKKKISLSRMGNKNWSKRPEVRKKMSDKKIGKVSWNKGLTKETNAIIKRISESKMGKNNHCWKGGITHKSYCEKWNETLREKIRSQYNRKCYLCSIDEKDNITKNSKIRKLSVHHIDNDKGQGCNGKKWKLVPLCMICHSKIHHNKMVILNE